MQNPLMLLLIVTLAMFSLMAIGVHIAVALALPGLIGFLVFQKTAGLTAYIPYNTLNSFVLTAVPLFIFMGEVLVLSGASDLIYRSVSRMLSWAPGGLLHSNIGACALFAAVSGSSPATAATVGSVAIPELKKRGYDGKLTLGSLAAGGTLGILIPPSINMIIYAVLTETSVGKLFAGGVMPGILLSLMFMIYIAIRVLLDRSLAPKENAHLSVRNVARSLVELWPLYFLGVIVLGGIFAGIMTPTEAAAIGASASIIIAIVLRRFNLNLLKRALANSAQTTCMVLFIVMGASILSSFLSRAGIPIFVAQLITRYQVSGWTVIILISVLYLILGCFIDPVSFMVLTMPTILPMVKYFGFDLVWFGIVVIILSEIGMITPPMGINLFVIQGISNTRLSEVTAGSVPFFILMIVAIALLAAFPIIVLWLPSLIVS